MVFCGGLLASAGFAQDVFVDVPADDDIPTLEMVTVTDKDQPTLDPEKTGSRTFSEEDIKALSGAVADPNELLEILPNTQFDNTRGRLNAETAGDLSPTRVSIAGGRFYENNFFVDGVSTNSQLDVISQRSFDNPTGSTQSVFLDADLLKSFEVIDSNVSARYGDFLGGVVRAETRDPLDVFSFSISSQYSSSDWTTYLIKDEDRSDPLPGETEFTRIQNRISIDIPLRDDLTFLFAFTRAEADVTRGALSSAYFAGERTRTTIKDNYLIKLLYRPTDDSTLSLQSIITPYEDQYYRTNLSRQFGGGSSTKLGYQQAFDRSDLDISLAYTTTENSREEDPNHFIFANTTSVDWVPDNRNSASFGGFGDLDVSQETLQLDATHTISFDNSRLQYGLQASRVSAQRVRPQTNFGYRGAVETFGFPIVSSTPNDGTIIQNEQFLTERNDYRAFSAEAEILQLGLFSEYSHDIIINDWLTIVPSFGLRYQFDDFLDNHNIAPRTNVRFELPSDVSVTLGYNRYFGKNQLAYALREQNPDSFIYRRDFEFDGEQFVLGDFELDQQRRFTAFRSGELDTPYSDEVSAALSFPLFDLGNFRIKALSRDNKRGLARSEAIETTEINELGQPFTFDRFELTNRGQSEYQSLSLEWEKTWRNHTFTASTTFSETSLTPGTDNFFSATDIELESERVFYRGQLVSFSELDVQRSNFNTPFYIAFGWVSRWLDDRLVVGFRGRFRDSYETITDSGDTVDENGAPGGGFELYEDVQLSTQFIIDSTISYAFQTERFGDAVIDLKVGNIFNSSPNVPVSKRSPYQEGRSFAVGMKFTF